jgi:murein DD-endopeptidase MepM/ murein hydrolase activator NlpD
MSKAQQAIDGVQGKDWKITSIMGNRIHPVTKVAKHHNGTDIWSPHEPCWIEAPYDGVITEAKKSTAPGGGFGNFVMIAHKINGEQYTTVYAHMQDGSVKVKVGQKVEAGTPLGKMGTTGMSTGKHLHWELHKGKKYEWSATGLNFIEPVAFFDALIKLEGIKGTAKDQTPADAPAAPAPVHGKAKQKAVAPKPVSVAPAKGARAYPGRLLRRGEPAGPDVLYIQNKLGVNPPGPFGPLTHSAVVALQKKHKLKADGIVGPLTWSKLG